MAEQTKTLSRLHHLKRELDALYFTADYDRLKHVIDGIRAELDERRRAGVKCP